MDKNLFCPGEEKDKKKNPPLEIRKSIESDIMLSS